MLKQNQTQQKKKRCVRVRLYNEHTYKIQTLTGEKKKNKRKPK